MFFVNFFLCKLDLGTVVSTAVYVRVYTGCDYKVGLVYLGCTLTKSHMR